MLRGFMQNHAGPKNVQEDKKNMRLTESSMRGGAGGWYLAVLLSKLVYLGHHNHRCGSILNVPLSKIIGGYGRLFCQQNLL
jgi:hypothetical protein